MRKILRIFMLTRWYLVIWFVLWSTIAFGTEIKPIPGVFLRQGEIAPAEGILFFHKSLIAVVNALKELEHRRLEVINLQAQVGTLKAESEELQTAIGQLKEANQKLDLANQKADFMISNFNVILGMYKQALVDVQASRQALVEDNKALRSELWWAKVFSALPIVGLVATIFAGM